MLPNERTTRSDIATLPGEMEGIVVAAGRNSGRPLVNFLRSQHVNVQVLVDADTAFEEALIHPPDVILVDDGIAPAGGIELCQRLKNNTRTHFVPVVLWSPHDDRQYRLRAWAVGADAVFVAGMDAQEKRTRLWSLLRSHGLYRRQEQKRHSQGSEIQTRRRWVTAFVHDLQSQLAGLQGNIEFLRTVGLPENRDRPAAVAGTRGEIADSFNEAAALMAEMANGLRIVLDYENLESGRLSLQEGDVDVDGLVRDVLEQSRPLAERTGKPLLRQGYAREGATVRGDRDLLCTTLRNLVADALLQPLNDRVLVAVETVMSRSAETTTKDAADEERVRFLVHGDTSTASDAPRELERSFEPYARPLSHMPVGHGVGLALAKAIVEMHGGSLRVSAGIGTGAMRPAAVRPAAAGERPAQGGAHTITTGSAPGVAFDLKVYASRPIGCGAG